MKRLLLLVATVGVLFVACNENEEAPSTPPTNVRIAVESVTLSEPTASLTVGDTLRLIASVYPANATNTSVTWQSSDRTVAIVENGLITALWCGETTITVMTNDGRRTATSIVAVDFPADEELPIFSMNDVVYAYPVPDQQYFLQGEHLYGFIRLTHNFGCLFSDANSTIKARFTGGSLNGVEAPITWDASTNTMTWTQPQFSNSTTYTLEIVRTSNTNEEYVLLSYEFRTSMFNTFSEKMGQIVVERSRVISWTITIRYVIANMTTQEGFCRVDLRGGEHTQNSPLIVVHSAMTDAFFLNTIRPLLYDPYPFGGFVRFSREPGQSIIPYWAIGVDPWYESNPLGYFPWNHSLSRVFYRDFQDARRQLLSAPTTIRQQWQGITVGRFPLLHEGKYDLLFFYTLPNGLVTDSSVVKTLAVP